MKRHASIYIAGGVSIFFALATWKSALSLGLPPDTAVLTGIGVSVWTLLVGCLDVLTHMSRQD